jgi:2-aminomuconate deaminase
MSTMKKILEAAGSNMDNVLKIACFLTDTKDYPAYNKVRAKWFPRNPPASTTVVVKELVRPGLVIEVEAMAFVPEKGVR